MLPTIHLDDLCNIVTEIIEIPPESRYILAIDESKNTLYEITKVLNSVEFSTV
jgi:adenylate kinase